MLQSDTQIIDAGTPIIEDVTDINNNSDTKDIASMTDPQKIAKYEFLQTMLTTPTSTDDIRAFLGGQVKILNDYREINNFKSLVELLEPYSAVVILYPNYGQPNCGHWVTLFSPIGRDRLEYFDSYGCMIDEKVVTYDNASVDDMGRKAQRSHQPQIIEPQLIKLILDSPYVNNTYWNEIPYQSEEFNFADCGLWCCCRLLNKQYNEDGFRGLFYSYPLSQGIEPDCAMVLYLYNKFKK
jgi:hypothetical protein